GRERDETSVPVMRRPQKQRLYVRATQPNDSDRGGQGARPARSSCGVHMRPLASTSRLTRLLAGGSAAVLVAGLAAGCSSEEDAAAGDVVKVGTLRGQPHFYAPYLYEDHASGDVTYEVVALDTAPALSDALVSGQIDFA